MATTTKKAEAEEAAAPRGVDALVSVRFDGDDNTPTATRIMVRRGVGFILDRWTPSTQEIADLVKSKEITDQGLHFTVQVGEQAHRSLSKQAETDGEAFNLEALLALPGEQNPQLALGMPGAGTVGVPGTSTPPGGQPTVGEPATGPGATTGTTSGT